MPRPAPEPVPGPVPTTEAADPIAPGSVPIEQIMDWLGKVPDPEIPVLSVTDLGIVRTASWDGDELVVVVTPTYSGCPA
ncbi:MAG: iron-sulfur cluster assembly protein, partial [Pseudomonadota bacterium]